MEIIIKIINLSAKKCENDWFIFYDHNTVILHFLNKTMVIN